MSGRFSACTELANLCLRKADGKTGFQQFLYPEDKRPANDLMARAETSKSVRKLRRDAEPITALPASTTNCPAKKNMVPAFPATVQLRTCPLLSTSNEDSGYLESALPYITDQATGKASLAAP